MAFVDSSEDINRCVGEGCKCRLNPREMGLSFLFDLFLSCDMMLMLCTCSIMMNAVHGLLTKCAPSNQISALFPCSECTPPPRLPVDMEYRRRTSDDSKSAQKQSSTRCAAGRNIFPPRCVTSINNLRVAEQEREDQPDAAVRRLWQLRHRGC